jgi:hypothetical protein
MHLSPSMYNTLNNVIPGGTTPNYVYGAQKYGSNLVGGKQKKSKRKSVKKCRKGGKSEKSRKDKDRRTKRKNMKHRKTKTHWGKW